MAGDSGDLGQLGWFVCVCVCVSDEKQTPLIFIFLLFCFISLLREPCLVVVITHMYSIRMKSASPLHEKMLRVFDRWCFNSLFRSHTSPPLPPWLVLLNALFLWVELLWEIRSPGHVTSIDHLSPLFFYSSACFLWSTVTRASVFGENVAS